VGEYVAGQYPGNEPAEVLTGHLSHRVAAEEVRRADLVLALDRSHRAELAQLHPGGRTRTFTLRQAAAAAAMVAEALRTTGPPEGAPPMPQGSAERFAWWVAEMDAARAYVNGTDTLAPGSLLIDALDIPDPHVVGYQYHPITVEFIEAATAELVSGFAEVLRYGSDQMPDPQA
jgi:protein-tyrosine-phosphatase